MNWQQVAPGVILLLVKLTGTSLFFVFFPQIFPKGNITSISTENSSVWPPSPEQTSSFSPLYPATVRTPLKQPRWERFRGHDYLFSEEKNTWQISQLECEDWTSKLLIIDDTKELEFIINKTAMANYFIGLTYSEPIKKWKWIDHKDHNMILFPIKATMDKECAAILAGNVSPVSCNDEYNWICEKTYS
ncbi:PREDICTED: C-type lectin domain family 5 member A-like isoform X1 [Thamnophis sirtalis]|uniref:C-type lectin domain family 5 member A-like isoform X1 n=1 Tax=Thamnophis sirtalis TaxID=35019 RepID=A0A6I9Y921_9SAUR|nr:PREDICTED: C-type lectin domain family 5 member A-like isoform X1 [Thamnophis sirtalis]